MKVFALGGAGAITREALRDLLDYSTLEQITIGDCNEEAGQEVAAWLADERVRFEPVDLTGDRVPATLLAGYDLVLDGTPISLNDRSAALIAQAGVNAINLNGMSNEWDFDEAFRGQAKTFVPGFGMTPGLTNLLVRHAADQLDTVQEVFISHGSFRPIAFSKSITETTVIEYDPHLPTRTVFEDGQFVQVPPFARPKKIRLPDPFGEQVQYIIPHPEGLTLSTYLADKGVRLIEVRGTWPPKNMTLLKALHEWGFLRNDSIQVNGVELGILDAIGHYLQQSPEGTTTELYGYALHVEVIGSRAGRPVRHILTTSHPPSDGTVEGWSGLRAYTRSVGIPFAIGADLILRGLVTGPGVVSPERAFDPAVVFAALQKRDIFVHEEIVIGA
jgi:saccharopine dehydrogenase-like NADP-dependent oxidoreductase